MQQQAKETERARVIAALNIYNSLFMVGSAVLGIVTLSVLELTIVQLFLVLALLNFAMAVYLFRQVPVFVVCSIVRGLTAMLYRVNLKNLHHIPKEGGALIVCNHVSYMDAVVGHGSLSTPDALCYGRRLRQL